MVVLPGATVIEVPLPAEVPPQELLYHCQVAPVPKEPPTTVKVVLPPAQMVVVPLIELGAVESVCTVTVVLAQVVVLQVPSART